MLKLRKIEKFFETKAGRIYVLRDLALDVAEGASGTTTPGTLNVTLSEPSDQVVTVAWQTNDSNAVAPADYTADSGTLTFQPGQTVRPINVTVRRALVSAAKRTP